MNQKFSNEDVILETENLCKKSPLKRALWSLILVFIFSGGLYFYFQDYLACSEQLKANQAEFASLFMSYHKNARYWDEKKEEVMSLLEAHRRDGSIFKNPLSFDNLPFELLLSYLVDEANMEQLFEEGFSFYPIIDKRYHPTFLVSKPHPILGLLGCYQSAEIELINREGVVHLEVKSAKLGDVEVAAEDFYTNFEKEIQALRPFSGTFSGPTRFDIHDGGASQQSPSSSKLRMSVAYLQTGIGVGNF